MIFNRLSEKREQIETDINLWPRIFSEENGFFGAFGRDLKESTYFACIKIISESIAKCSLQLKKEEEKGERLAKEHYLFEKLKLRPNPYMSSVNCFKTFVTILKHYGIAGLYINRKGSIIEGLYPVKITQITIDNAGIINSTKNNKMLYSVESVENEQFDCFERDLIVLRDFSLDGINTRASKNICRETLDTSIKSQKYLNKLFSNGLTNKMVVQLTSDIKDEKTLKKIQDKFDRVYSNNGKIFTIPAGYNVSALNLSLADAQYEQLRKLSKEEIATIMNVPLTKLGFVKENAKSEEQDNLKFLQDTLLVIFLGLEQEMDFKLLSSKDRKDGYKIRFNVNSLLRTDAKSQADVINSYVKSGIYDLDHAKEIVGAIKLGGDPIITLPSGQVLLSNLLKNNINYQKKEGDPEDD